MSRLDYGGQAHNPTHTPTPIDFNSLVDDIKECRYEELLEVDQLKDVVACKRAFLGFEEPPITFPPTFKVSKVSQLLNTADDMC